MRAPRVTRAANATAQMAPHTTSVRRPPDRIHRGCLPRQAPTRDWHLTAATLDRRRQLVAKANVWFASLKTRQSHDMRNGIGKGSNCRGKLPLGFGVKVKGLRRNSRCMSEPRCRFKLTDNSKLVPIRIPRSHPRRDKHQRAKYNNDGTVRTATRTRLLVQLSPSNDCDGECNCGNYSGQHPPRH
jgi:hypothetical protein